MGKKEHIESTTEAWEERQLGADEEFVEVAEEFDEKAADEALELKMISIRLQESLIEDLKAIAQINGIGYQPLIRQILNRFADAEKKKLLREKQNELENRDPDPKKGLRITS
ncbi:MAG: hypothetical protein J5I81_06360 [Nitrococcus mobilis]|nr:hypothetical protein [Nitrococcus mobilis]